jgi:hypothetical protein
VTHGRPSSLQAAMEQFKSSAAETFSRLTS